MNTSKFLIIIFVLFSLTGCFDKEEENDACNYNSETEATVQQLVDALVEPFKNSTVNLKTNEYLHYQENLKAQNSTIIKYFDYQSQLTCVDNIENNYQFRKVVDGTEYSQKPGRTEKDFSLPILNTNSAQLVAKSYIKNIISDAYKNLSVSEKSSAEAGCGSNTPEGITFHNLRTHWSVEKAPTNFIANGCPGLESCELDTFNIQFKIVQKISNSEVATMNHEIRLSPQIPFYNIMLMPDGYLLDNQEGIIYNGLLSHCKEFWTPDNVYVRICTFLKNFSYGDEAPTYCQEE